MKGNMANEIHRLLIFKRISVFIITFYIYSTFGYAQLLLGGKLGLNTSSATVDTRNIKYTTTETISRIQFGAVYDHAFHQNLALRAELLYSEKGYGIRKYFDETQFDSKNIQNSSEWQMVMQYVELPLMLKWFAESKTLKFYINGGMYFAYWAAANQKGSFFTPNLGDQFYSRKTAEQSYSFDNDFGANKRKDNRWDYGLVIGSGLSYKIKKGEFFVEARYAYGLADRYVFQQKPIFYQPQFNRNWTISFGFLYTIKPQKVKIKRPDIEENDPNEEEETE